MKSIVIMSLIGLLVLITQNLFADNSANEEQTIIPENKILKVYTPSCANCHSLAHGNPFPNVYTQEEIESEIQQAVNQAVSQAISDTIMKYDPDQDGKIGLKEIIYYLQVVSGNF